MLFTHNLAKKVLDGTKTQTRRLCRPKEIIGRNDDGDIVVVHRPSKAKSVIGRSLPGAVRFEVGKVYAVQPGRGRFGIGKVRITAIRRERLLDISWDDAAAEGFSIHPSDFVLAFYEINRGTVKHGANPWVWVLTLEVVK